MHREINIAELESGKKQGDATSSTRRAAREQRRSLHRKLLLDWLRTREWKVKVMSFFKPPSHIYAAGGRPLMSVSRKYVHGTVGDSTALPHVWDSFEHHA